MCNTRTLWIAGPILSALVPTASALSPVPPQERFCSISTLKGTYAYSGSGVTKETGSPGVVYVQAGMESYDGKGHVVGYGSEKTSATDDASNKRYAGTYTVNGDCTGTLTYDDAGTTLEENIYVNPDGNALRYLSRTQGQFWAGEEQRISRKLIIK
ncbi:MAG: hypothetical protein RLZZ09_2371 [Pseudomonadota bacterium]|jgi:hypothetical protein